MFPGAIADEPQVARPYHRSRSLLVAPATSPRFLEKAAASDADGVLIDLEDAVSFDEKASAREAAIQAVNELDFGGKTVSVRINAPDTPFMYRDLIEVAEKAGPRLGLIMVPKVGCAADIHMIDTLLRQIEAATARAHPLGLEVQIETAAGLTQVESIATGAARLEGLHFGPGDFAASVGARTTSIGGFSPDYGVLADADVTGARVFHPNDPWHYAQARIVIAARAAALRPMDGPYADFRDAEGLRRSARRSAMLGFEGKWAIHPDQVTIINEAFSPSEPEIDAAQAIIEALERAKIEGRGAVTLNGRMIDTASIRQALQLLAKARP